MNDPFLNILDHSRNMMIEQIMRCEGGNKARRNELEKMPTDKLRAIWQQSLGDALEEVGI